MPLGLTDEEEALYRRSLQARLRLSRWVPWEGRGP